MTTESGVAVDPVPSAPTGPTSDATVLVDPTGGTSGGPNGWWTSCRTGIGLALIRVVVGIALAEVVVTRFRSSVLHTPLGTLSTGGWLEAFDRWDARYYLTIAAHGYPAHATDFRAFFPGYPLVIRAVHTGTGGLLGYPSAAVVVSVVAFTLTAGLLYRLVARHTSTRTALITTLLFCWFPTSVFFLAPYSESLFALEIVAVAVLVDRGRWWWAALVAGFASATSPESVVLTAALVVAAVVARRGTARIVGYAIVGSLGAAGFVAYLAVRFHRPFAFSDALTGFHREAVVPVVSIIQNIDAIAHVVTTPHPGSTGVAHLSQSRLWTNVVWMWSVDDVAIILALVALAALVTVSVRARRRGEALGTAVPIAWMVVLAGITLLASATAIRAPGGPVSTEAAARLVSVAFPLYLGLALVVRPRAVVAGIAVGVFVVAALVTQVLFTLGYWVT